MSFGVWPSSYNFDGADPVRVELVVLPVDLINLFTWNQWIVFDLAVIQFLFLGYFVFCIGSDRIVEVFQSGPELLDVLLGGFVLEGIWGKVREFRKGWIPSVESEVG